MFNQHLIPVFGKTFIYIVLISFPFWEPGSRVSQLFIQKIAPMDLFHVRTANYNKMRVMTNVMFGRRYFWPTPLDFFEDLSAWKFRDIHHAWELQSWVVDIFFLYLFAT